MLTKKTRMTKLWAIAEKKKRKIYQKAFQPQEQQATCLVRAA